MALGIKARKIIQTGIDDLTPFKVGSVEGEWYDAWEDVPTGRLPVLYVECMKGEFRSTGEIYVIHSYGTPIAWQTKGVGLWEIPGVKYSQTTTNHESIVKTAIDNRGFYNRF